MLNETLKTQKEELKTLLTRNLHKRAKFDTSMQLMRQGIIKAIIGPRRAGKSTFALSLIKELGEEFIYLNFDNSVLSKIDNHLLLDEAIIDVYGKDIKYIFVDEVQNLYDWELWINTLHRRGYNIILTGSNANLLSKELATHLTGRHIEIEILPFSYTEYGGDFDVFYKLGGFPDILLNKYEPKSYIESLEDSILYKDIISRYKVRNPDIIKSLYTILSANVSNIYSYKKIKEALELKSEITVRKYIQYIYDTYLCIDLFPFKTKVSLQYKSQKKAYLVDNQFIKNSVSLSDMEAKKFENFIFTELIKNGYIPNKNLFYFKTKNEYEIDFLLKDEGRIKKAVQVCFSLTNLDTREREMRALYDASKELAIEEYIIVTDKDVGEYVYKGLKITVMTAKDFVVGL